mmetsp:Transcript_41863/g.129377  ORF Transcript_41863/g.129377 Transcript_41863/m.129377 type:complete len:294 (-) Transcript_41863:32-913(-)
MLNSRPNPRWEEKSRRFIARMELGPAATDQEIQAVVNTPPRKIHHPTAATRIDDRESLAVNWDALPPCPIKGFTLREAGLIDLETNEPLTPNEMKMLINEMMSIEARALYSAECRTAPTAVGRMADHTLEAGPLGMYGFAAYFGFRKFPNAYDSAYPQNSLYVKWRAKKHMSSRELEQFCMRHRTVLNLTNSRPVLFMTLSVFLGSLGYLSSRRAGIDSVADQDTRQAMAYFRHVEGTMKWTWTVFHCHPAYKNGSVPTRPGSQPEQISFAKIPDFPAMKRKVLGERERADTT